MYIREAGPDDNQELQELQRRCPMGTSLIVSTVNTPDFFARAKAYESYEVFVACDDDRIVGSGACAIRDGLVGGELHRVGYQFQAFTSPDCRRQGVARLFHRHIEDYLTRQGAGLSYVTIMEGNLPSMRLVEGHGFELHRTLVMPALVVYEEMDVPCLGTIRPVSSADLPSVAELLNETWQGHELYEPASSESLAGFVERTPHCGLDNLLVLEDQGEIVACVGYWDWSKITEITVLALSRRMRMTALMLRLVGLVRPMPPFVKGGDMLKQLVLTRIGFRDPEYLQTLLRHLNNRALGWGVQQIFCICETDHPLLRSLRGFIRIDTAQHLYVKPFRAGVAMGDGPVFMDGVDL